MTTTVIRHVCFHCKERLIAVNTTWTLWVGCKGALMWKHSFTRPLDPTHRFPAQSYAKLGMLSPPKSMVYNGV